jgi:hypothetical protein
MNRRGFFRVFGVGAATAALAPAAAVSSAIEPPTVYRAILGAPTLRTFTDHQFLTAADLNHNFELLRKQLKM